MEDMVSVLMWECCEWDEAMDITDWTRLLLTGSGRHTEGDTQQPGVGVGAGLVPGNSQRRHGLRAVAEEKKKNRSGEKSARGADFFFSFWTLGSNTHFQEECEEESVIHFSGKFTGETKIQA